MQLMFIGIAVAVVAVALVIRTAVRRHARGKCRSLIAVAKAVLEDGFGSEIGGRNALSRLTDAAAIRAKHGFAVADIGLEDEAEFDALFSKAVAAANPSLPAMPQRAPDEQRPVTRTMPVAPAMDPDDEITLTDIKAPTGADARTAEDDDEAPTIPGFRVPTELLETADGSDDESGVNTDIFGSQRREDLN